MKITILTILLLISLNEAAANNSDEYIEIGSAKIGWSRGWHSSYKILLKNDGTAKFDIECKDGRWHKGEAELLKGHFPSFKETLSKIKFSEHPFKSKSINQDPERISISSATATGFSYFVYKPINKLAHVVSFDDGTHTEINEIAKFIVGQVIYPDPMRYCMKVMESK